MTRGRVATLKRPYHQLREQYRVHILERWASARVPVHSPPERTRVAFLAGFGNTSYGDTYIGLGTAQAAVGSGVQPLLLGRGNHGAAFERAGVSFTALPTRANGLAEYEAAIRNCSAVVLAGGGIFEDRVDGLLAQSLSAGYAARLLAAANRGMPTAVHAVGLGSQQFQFESTERLVGDALRTARTVGLRDHRGVAAARDRFGVDARLVVDSAVITLGKVQRQERPPNGRAAFIPFARLAWPFISTPDAVAHARQQPDWEVAATRLTGFDEVVVVPFHSSDLNFVGRIVDTIAQRRPGITVTVAPFTPDDPLQAIDVLATCGSTVTMRYHGYVASYFAGIRDIEVIGTSQKLLVTAELDRQGWLAEFWNPAKAERELRETLAIVLS